MQIPLEPDDDDQDVGLTISLAHVKARIVHEYNAATRPSRHHDNNNNDDDDDSFMDVEDNAKTNSLLLEPADIRIMLKGRALTEADDSTDMRELLQQAFGSSKRDYKLIATLAPPSSQEAKRLTETAETAAQRSHQVIRVRDDLTDRGREEMEQRQRLGKYVLHQAAMKEKRKRASGDPNDYGFGRIQVLPNLPDQDQAREILTALANDPGILACMRKHQWRVGALMEMYPEGKVGESEVCIMGLNTKKGQTIQLRIRTDDLQGFRKMLSIRQVLYHELAHNVHGEHNANFFQLMRQIEKECTQLDWTQGAGLSRDDSATTVPTTTLYTAGTYRLGSAADTAISQPSPSSSAPLTARERAAQAALSRQSQLLPGCGQEFICQQCDTSSSGSSSSSNENKEKGSYRTDGKRKDDRKDTTS